MTVLETKKKKKVEFHSVPSPSPPNDIVHSISDNAPVEEEEEEEEEKEKTQLLTDPLHPFIPDDSNAIAVPIQNTDTDTPASAVADIDVAAAAVEEEKQKEEEVEEETKGSTDRDIVLARVSTEKRLAIIKAWEQSEKAKAENKALKKKSSIGAWEQTQKAEIEAELKKLEEKVERKKAEYAERMRNKMANLQRETEEKRANIEAKRGEDILKAEELAAKYRATGTTPKTNNNKKGLWFFATLNSIHNRMNNNNNIK